MPKTIFEKIWDAHRVCDLGGGVSLLHVDRHFIHDLEAGPGLTRIAERGYTVRRPDLTFATPDHTVASAPAGTVELQPRGERLLESMRRRTAAAHIRLFDVHQPGQGIAHVIGPELGISQPGMLIVCADSHTCTHGGLGSIAFGIGASEVMHVLATQTIRQRRPKLMKVSIEGERHAGVTAKDIVLHTIGRLGTAAGRGHAVEWAGPVVRSLSMDERLTLCNLSIEMGSKIGLVAPDETTFDYLAGCPWAPRGEQWTRAVEYWRTLASDEGAEYDAEHRVDVSEVAPQITWGTSPEDVLPVTGTVPDPAQCADTARRSAMQSALDYMGLTPGAPIAGTPVQWVFIGSCANSRLSDLRAAAQVVAGRQVAAGVHAWVVPGSEATRRAAEAEGLDRIFAAAGFEWRQPGCSLCLAANGDRVPAGERCVSTSNRNFVGRQGPGARTHLASPAMAAAAAVTGVISDVRRLEPQR